MEIPTPKPLDKGWKVKQGGEQHKDRNPNFANRLLPRGNNNHDVCLERVVNKLTQVAYARNNEITKDVLAKVSLRSSLHLLRCLIEINRSSW